VTGASTSLPLLAVNLIASAIWIGGLVAILLVARAADRTIAPAQRVEFFKVLGRSYGIVAGTALVVALATGVVLLRHHAWSSTQVAAAAIAGALVIATAAGMLQARTMTRLRRATLESERAEDRCRELRRGTLLASGLRGAIGLLTLALTVLAAALART
jgi:uncharacterized membrane protein